MTQPAILVENMDRAMDWMHAMFGAYPSERVRIARAGLNNAVYALNNITTIELIEPYDPNGSASRLLARTGPGWHMLTMDVEKRDRAELDAAIEGSGVRVVQKDLAASSGWHMHPRDTHGVLLFLGDRADHDDLSPWAGHTWREYVGTNTHVVHSVLGVSLTVDDLEAARGTYERLGLSFGAQFQDSGDDVLEARAPRSTIFQVRRGKTAESNAGALLEGRGPGLFQLFLRAKSLDVVKDRLRQVGGRVAEERPGVVVTEAATTLGVQMEFRQEQ